MQYSSMESSAVAFTRLAMTRGVEILGCISPIRQTCKEIVILCSVQGNLASSTAGNNSLFQCLTWKKGFCEVLAYKSLCDLFHSVFFSALSFMFWMFISTDHLLFLQIFYPCLIPNWREKEVLYLSWFFRKRDGTIWEEKYLWTNPKIVFLNGNLLVLFLLLSLSFSYPLHNKIPCSDSKRTLYIKIASSKNVFNK